MGSAALALGPYPPVPARTRLVPGQPGRAIRVDPVGGYALFAGSADYASEGGQRTVIAMGTVVMEMLGGWTGHDACALQSALRMSNQTFASHLRIGLRTVADWHEKPDMRPRPETQRIPHRQ